MKCIICGSEKIQSIDTIISEFVYERITSDRNVEDARKKTKLCFCEDCTFAFYEYRLSEREADLLYRNYRDEEYQKTREKYEFWYTKKINDTLNHSNIQERQKTIWDIVSCSTTDEMDSALDFGGNNGEMLSPEGRYIKARNRYVYDISGVDPVNGVHQINTFSELYNYHFDFIMCNSVFEHLAEPVDVIKKMWSIGDADTLYFLEVPSENPFIRGNKFSIIKNASLLFNPRYSWIRLAKYYFKQRKQPLMPMKEHINFFTIKSVKTMLESNGYYVIKLQEIEIKSPLGKASSIVALFKKASDTIDYNMITS